MIDKPQSLIVHLEEIRHRFLVCFFSLALFTVLCFIFKDPLLDFLKHPARGELQQLAVFSPTAAISSFMKIAAMGGAILSLPVIFYQVWMFLLPALEPKSQKKGLVFIGSGTLLFLTGACMSYFLLLPAALHFLLSIGKNDLVFLISLDAYISFVLFLIVSGGIIFEMPMLVFMLAKLGALSAEQMLKGWKVAMILILIASALLTPTPDAVNMMFMAVPLFALYLVSISVAKFAGKKH